MAEPGCSLFEFIESKIFSSQINQLEVEILSSIQSDLVQNPQRGAIVQGDSWCSESQGCKSCLAAWKERRIPVLVSLP